MEVAALGFLTGVVVLQQLSSLPDLWFSGFLFLSVLGLLFAPRLYPKWREWQKWRLILVFLLSAGAGFCWATIAGYLLLADGLDPALEGQDVVVEGVIASLPETQNRRVRFEFEPDSILNHGKAQALPGKLLLSWYHRSNICARLCLRSKARPNCGLWGRSRTYPRPSQLCG